MRRCNFCFRWFKNKQAIKAHLQFCESYLFKKGLIDVWVCENCGNEVKREPPRGPCQECHANSWIKKT